MSTARPHLVRGNPSAGGGRARELLPRLEGALRDHEINYRLVMTTSLDHGVEEARAAAAGGEIPVVMSGDGLIGQIGGVLVGTGTPLGVIPGGRGNDLARVLGIPTDVDRAVAVLAEGTSRAIRSEEHTSELQSHSDLVCRLLLEKKKKNKLCIPSSKKKKKKTKK